MFDRNRRQFEWPWKDVLYFAASLVVIACALVVAVMLFIENDNLRQRIKANEDFIDTIPGLLEDIRKELCDKVDALRDDLTDRIETIEESFQPLIEKGVADGYAPLDENAIVPEQHLPFGLGDAMFLGNDGGGCWDASTNIPMLQCGQECNIGEFYVINNTGTSILDSFGGLDDPWQIGDAVVCTGDIGWKRVRDIPRVKTWNGLTGDVEAFLDTLLDVDQTGASIGDALVLSPGNIWKPTECCVTGIGSPPGFFARFVGRFAGANGEKGQSANQNTWTAVDFELADRFPIGSPAPNSNGARFAQTNPSFVHQDANPVSPFLGGAGTYTIPKTGWYQVQSRIRLLEILDSDFAGMRLFRINAGREIVYQQDTNPPTIFNSGGTGSGPEIRRIREHNQLEISGVFAFCIGEQLQMQFYDSDDDNDNEFTLLSAPGPPYNNPFIFRPTGGMYWSMSRMPDVLMPRITTCVGFFGKRGLEEKRSHDHPYQTEWADPALTYRIKLRRWQQNTAFYNNQCGVPVNCTHYKPGPKPEMPPSLKPLPPEDSERKK